MAFQLNLKAVPVTHGPWPEFTWSMAPATSSGPIGRFGP